MLRLNKINITSQVIIEELILFERYFVMHRKCKQWWSTILPILTRWTTSFYIKQIQKKGTVVLQAWDRLQSVARFNTVIWIPPITIFIIGSCFFLDYYYNCTAIGSTNAHLYLYIQCNVPLVKLYVNMHWEKCITDFSFSYFCIG